MFKNFREATVFHVNRFQRNLFYPVVTAFLLGCIVSWLCIVYMMIGNYFANPALYRFQQMIPSLLSLVTVLMILIIIWTLRISGRYFGAYERIVGELDKVLDGSSKTPLKARKEDVIFEDLLERINTLIEQKQ